MKNCPTCHHTRPLSHFTKNRNKCLICRGATEREVLPDAGKRPQHIPKSCSRCSVLKHEREFTKNKLMPDGRKRTCKRCDNIRVKELSSSKRKTKVKVRPRMRPPAGCQWV